MKITGPALGGKAGVLGTSTNPIGVYMQYQRQRAQQDYMREQEVKKRRDETFDYVGKYNPEAMWEPFNAEVNNMADGVRLWVQHELNSGKDPNQIQAKLAYRQGVVNNFGKETGTWKDIHDKALTAIKGDAKYSQEAVTALHDIFFQPTGRPQPKEYIRQNLSAVNQILYNPDLMNPSVVTKKFMDGLPEQNRQTVGMLQKQDGTYLTSQELTAKLPYLRDSKGVPVIDPHTQQPIPVVDDNLYTFAMGSQDMRLMMQKFGSDTKAGQEAWLKTVLPGQDKVSYKQEIKGGFKKTEGERTAGETATAIDERFQNNEKIVSGFRPDLVASTFDPYKSHQVEYITENGKSVVKEENGIYYDIEGKRVGKPTKLRVSFTKGGLTDFQMAMIEMDNNLTKLEKEAKITKLQEEMGKLNNKEFDITTKPGKRAAHHVLNRLLDEFLSPKERQAESYTKKVNEYYDQGQTGGVYTR